MPSYRVVKSMVSLNIFDVVGRDGGETGFIGHTGLAERSGLQQAAKIPVLDMQPPLHGPGGPGHLIANVVGNAVLTDDEVQKIRTFIDRHSIEHLVFQQLNMWQVLDAAPQMYCIRPHAVPFCEDDGRYARMRFSCAGFVFEAYESARIKSLDSNALPMVDFEVIKVGYPIQVRLMESGRISREDLGLEGSGPWPVLLCGYLFHALNRNANAIRQQPYKPIAANRYFSGEQV